MAEFSTALPLLMVAPMVAQSDAPFRALCLRHGANVAYTEMLYSDKIVTDHTYLDAWLPLCDSVLVENRHPHDHLVVQICGNDPVIMAEAVKIIAANRDVAAIDLNLGCPQDRARDGLFGSFLLDKCHWERVFACVKAASDALKPFNIPFYCKVRLIEGTDIIDMTTQFCRGLIGNGAQLICIHGRTRGSTKKRRCGPADLAAIATIARTLHEEYQGRIPIISNGNITTPDDVVTALRDTHPCCGVMSAEGILSNPALFQSISTAASGGSSTVHQDSRSDAEAGGATNANGGGGIPLVRDRTAPSLLSLFREYCELSTEYAALGGWKALDAYYQRPRGGATQQAAGPALSAGCLLTAICTSSSTAPQKSVDSTELLHKTSTPAYVPESRQLYIARQHLAWMLGKSGHGRMVRYAHIGAQYKKHVHLMQAMSEASCVEELLVIAERCLPS